MYPELAWNYLTDSFNSSRSLSFLFHHMNIRVYPFWWTTLSALLLPYRNLATVLSKHTVQFSHSIVSDSLWPHGLQHAKPPCHHQLPELSQTQVRVVGDAIQPSLPLLSPSSAFNFSQHQIFSNESVLRIRCPRYWSFSFSISPFNEYSGQISFRMDWLDLLGVQGTLKSLLQHHSSKASILWCSAFFIVQLFTSIHDCQKNHSFD